ncbi:interaptin [Anabrus simplex]|uniref:interaptin n=1 Tax=Anabrus simplex TaxID=316456 RepID=UPI0035A37D71
MSFKLNTSEDHVTFPTDVRLMYFVSMMGYTGRMDIDCFKKFCGGDMCNIFEYLMTVVHPAPVVEARSKYEILQVVKQDDEIRGSSLKQFTLAKEHRELENRLSAKYKMLQEKEREAQEMRQRMLRLCNETQLQMSQNEDINKKTALLIMYEGVSRDTLNHSEDLVARTGELAMFTSRKNELEIGDVKDVLNKCQESVDSFQKHYRKMYLDADGSLDFQSVTQLHERKQALKDFIEKSFVPFSAQQLVEAVVQTQQELNKEFKNMVVSVDLQKDADQIRTEFDIPTSGSRCPGLLELAMIHLQRDAELSQLRKICTSKRHQLALLEEELINHPQESTTHDTVSDVKRKSIHLQLLHKDSMAKFLSEELNKQNKKSIDLRYLRWIIEKQRADICSLDAKRSDLLSFIIQNCDQAETFQHLLQDQAKVISKLESFDPGFFQALQECVDRLRGTVKEEIQLFDETPPYCLHHTISQDGFQMPTYKMLVNYGYSAHAEEGPLFGYGAPAKPVEETVSRLFQEKCYRSRLQLAEADQGLSLSLTQTRVREYKELQSSLSDTYLELQNLLNELIGSLESDKEELKNCLYSWVQLPFTSAIPCDQRVGGKTFTEWLSLYDCMMFDSESSRSLSNSIMGNC